MKKSLAAAALVPLLLTGIGHAQAQPRPPIRHSGSSAGSVIAGGILGLTTALVINEIAKGATPKKTVVINGADRELMRDIQERLNELGYDAGTADGISGPRTRAAIRAFQRDHDLPPTGKLGPDGLALLYKLTGEEETEENAEADAPLVGSPTSILGNDEGAAALALPDAMSFDHEIAKTIYQTAEAQPSILGFTLGADAASFTTALETSGFGNCTGTRAELTCDRTTDSLTDTITVWSTDADGVWAMVREISFPEPVQASFVRNQFSQSYPELVQQPQQTASSGADCSMRSYGAPALSALFHSRLSAGEDDVPTALANLAVTCPVAYSIQFTESSGLVSAVRTVFFDGTSVVRQQIRAMADTKNKIGADLVF